LTEVNKYLKIMPFFHIARGVVIITIPYILFQSLLGPLRDVDFALSPVLYLSSIVLCICLLEFYCAYALVEPGADHYVDWKIISIVTIPTGIMLLLTTLNIHGVSTNFAVEILAVGLMVGLSVIEVGLYALHTYSSH